MKFLLTKIASIKSPFVVGATGIGGIEVAEVIPQEGIKLVLQAIIAVAALVKFFKERKKESEK